MKNKIKYCYLNPVFPAEAYVCMIFITCKEKDFIDIQVLKPIFVSLSDVSEYLKELNSLPKPKDINLKLEETMIVFPIRFSSLYPLKKEYWDNPTYHVPSLERRDIFLKVHNNPQFYKLLVVPYRYAAKRWYFSAAWPFYLNVGSNKTENYMYQSFEPVYRQAKSAAFYLFSKPLRYDWVTRKLDDPDRQNILIN